MRIFIPIVCVSLDFNSGPYCVTIPSSDAGPRTRYQHSPDFPCPPPPFFPTLDVWTASFAGELAQPA